MAGVRTRLLQLTLPLVRSHGFTRHALAQSVLALPAPHPEPLSDTAVSALFGEGDEARRTLIEAWLDEGRKQMRHAPSRSIKDVLAARLRYNESVVDLLPEAFATLVTPEGIPFVDPRPALSHAAKVADEACNVVNDQSVGPSWYARRTSIAAIYTAAELHQLTSPKTAEDFLSSLLESSTKVESAVSEASQFTDYIAKSWAGIIKSRGII
ncbi:unnamed protein product [Somion occarium]|uniref:COQ9 C-terminal domain-containing protein n=1 Tax=Somion occarium TaxID=3059160 RepID=A0ABP1EC83_9APHY